MLQLILTMLLFLILVIPVGTYLYHIAAGKPTFADPLFDRVDGLILPDRRRGSRERNELEGICGSASGHERDYDTDGLSDPADPESAHPESQRCGSDGGIPFF